MRSSRARSRALFRVRGAIDIGRRCTRGTLPQRRRYRKTTKNAAPPQAHDEQRLRGLSPLVRLHMITRAEDDFGPATKLLPALRLETDPATHLITVDDDTTRVEPRASGENAESRGGSDVRRAGLAPPTPRRPRRAARTTTRTTRAGR